MVSHVVSAFLMVVLTAAVVSAEDQRPVTKVMNLLKDMVTQLHKEAEEDEKVKEEMDCWCETGLKEKTAAIDSAQLKIGQLNAEIPALAAKSSKLNNEISTLNQEIAHNSDGLDKSTTMRSQQLAEFNEDEKNMISSIGQMKGAIQTIAGNYEGTFERASQHARSGVRGLFLQQTPTAQENDMLEAVVAIQTQMRQHSRLVTAQQRTVVTAFLQSPDEYIAKTALLQQGTKYNPEHSSTSGPIYGVLKGMKESFQKDLSSTQAEESRNQLSYESLKTAKNTEISAAQSLSDTKSTELGNADLRRAEARQDRKDTTKTLAADIEYLKNLKEQCATVDDEFALRTKTRQEETVAVSKALAYLSSDDAMDMYKRTFSSASASSFFQKGMHSRRLAGARVLAESAARSHDKRLSALAASILTEVPAADQAGAMETKKASTFGRINQEVVDMIDKLVQEKADAMSHKDFCTDELNKNMRMTDTGKRTKANHQAKIGELTAHINKLATEMAELKAETSELQVMLKRAGEDRERVNGVFQQTITDQRGTQALLEGARGLLQSFYNKASLAQVAKHGAKSQQPAGRWLDSDTARKLGLMASYSAVSEPAGPPPPSGFKSYEKNAQSGGVLGMIQQIIDDCKAMAAEALTDEEAGQVAYETLVKETNESLIANERALSHKQMQKAATESEKAQSKIDLENTMDQLDELQKANLDLHLSCDYELKTFDSKQSARDDEILALKESIAIFEGAALGR